eukprot:Trichotokara_eunicae@DN5409_c0_g1_i2.p1
MLHDTTYEFEKRRNRPVKYDRDLWIKTIQAMKTIERIKERRKMEFYHQRMKAHRKDFMPQLRKIMKKHGHILDKMPEQAKVIRENEKRRAEGMAVTDDEDETIKEDVDMEEAETAVPEGVEVEDVGSVTMSDIENMITDDEEEEEIKKNKKKSSKKIKDKKKTKQKVLA